MIKRKQISHTKLIRFLEELNLILEDPLDPEISKKINEVTFGDKYEVNEDAIKQKSANAKLIRKK